jgi:hypothetical protein
MFAVDDELEASAKHEALDELPPERRSRAFEAWLRLGAACRKRGNGGLVTSALLSKILHSWKPSERARAAQDLVEARGGRSAGLWVIEGDGFRFHEWERWNPSAEEAEAERASVSAEAIRSRRYRMNKKSKRDGPRDADRDGERDASRSERDAERDGPRDADRDESSSRALRAGATRVRDPGPVPLPVPSQRSPSSSASESARDAFDSHQARVEAARTELVRSYAERYQRETHDAWMGASGQADRITTAAVWCASTADPIDAARRVVDGAFATERWARHRWPWKYIAEDPAACAAASTIAHTSTPASLAGIPRIEVPA